MKHQLIFHFDNKPQGLLKEFSQEGHRDHLKGINQELKGIVILHIFLKLTLQKKIDLENTKSTDFLMKSIL